MLAEAGLIAGEKAGRWVRGGWFPERLAQLRAALRRDRARRSGGPVMLALGTVG